MELFELGTGTVVGVVAVAGVVTEGVAAAVVVEAFGGAEVAETAGSTVGWGCGAGLAVTVVAGAITEVAGFGGATTFC